MRTITWTISILTFCILTTSCKKQHNNNPTSSYEVFVVDTSNYFTQNTYSASIQGKQDIEIYPQINGTIVEVKVEEGASVRKGEILFIIDQIPFQAALRLAEANVAAAKAQVSNAQLTYNSKKKLHEEQVISTYDLQMSENLLLTAKAQLAQAEAGEINARNNLSYTTVKSPSNGVIGKIPFKLGALVSPAMHQPLTTVSDNSEMSVYFSMSEKQILSLIRKHKSMEEAIADMPNVQLQLSDGSIYENKGVIKTISGVIDRATGSVSLKAIFPNDNRILISGGSGNILIPNNIPNCITIPQEATFEIQDKIYVYKVIGGVAKSAIIDVLPNHNGREYVVLNGLSVGDTLIAKGVGLIREGSEISIK